MRAGRPVRYVLDGAVFAAILIAALARLPEPFFGDQAVNLLMGQVIAEGGAPYRDLWDMEHPGVFLFFAAGGALFGFHELGIHLFELFWMLALAVCVRVMAGHQLLHGAIAGLAPALTVGTYYAVTTSYHVTQAEALVGLPMLVSLVTILAATGAHSHQHFRAWLFVSGLGAGVVFLFNATYVLVPAVFVLIAARARVAPGERLLANVRTMALPVLAGMVLPIAASAMYLVSRSGVELLWWTFVSYPFAALAECRSSPRRFVESADWFVRTFAVLLLLGGVGTWSRLRRGDAATAMLVAWAVLGLALLWVQVLSWWSYQYLLLFVPVGLLAAAGLDTLWSFASRQRTGYALRTLLIVALLLLAGLHLKRVQPIAGVIVDAFQARPLPFTTSSTAGYQATRYDSRAHELRTPEFLRRPDSQQGPIYVFAMPTVYHAARRRPAIPLIAAWFPPTVDLWRQLMRDLEKAAPPYILVHDEELEFIVSRNPALEGDILALRPTIERRYRALTDGAGAGHGTWYVRRDLDAASPKQEPPAP